MSWARTSTISPTSSGFEPQGLTGRQVGTGLIVSV
jgi:hypothetical protein